MRYSPLLLLAAALVPAVANAEEAARSPVLSPFPRLSIDALAELQSDAVVNASDSAAEFVDTYVTFTTDVALEIEEGTGLFGSFVFEPIRDAVDDRAPFEDHGLYVDSLFAAYDAGVAVLRAGKFAMPFGAAFDEAPGLYGADFAEDYELTERLGLDVSVPFAALGGEHALFASLFTADRTAMSGSIGAERGRLSAADGGPSNTGDLDSFSVGLAGRFGEAGYNLGIVRQAAGEGAGGPEEAEFGAVLGLGAPVSIGGHELGLMAEVAWFDGYGGADQQALYTTLGASYGFGDWTVSGAAAARSVSDGGSDDWLLTAGLDYAITEDISASAGYRWGDEGGVTSHTVGLYIGVAFGFTSND